MGPHVIVTPYGGQISRSGSTIVFRPSFRVRIGSQSGMPGTSE